MVERDPYEVLGVAPDAHPDAIAAAYRDQARRHHPDVSRAPDAEQRMAAINEAWSTLRDPARRAAWDRANGVVPRPAPAAPPPPAPGATATPRDPRPGSGHPPYGRHAPARPAPARPAPVRPSPFRPAPVRPAQQPVPQWRLGPNGEGAAGPPPGPRQGTVLPFGRHVGWSLGEVARVDPGYLAWLRDRREGAPYRAEIDRMLAAMTRRTAPPPSGGRWPGRRGRPG